MRRLNTWMSGLLLSCSLACVGATPPIQPSSRLASILKAEGFDSSYTISYKDEHGKAISEAAFSGGLAKSAGFNSQRDAAAHTVILSLQPKGSEVKISPTQLAAFEAAASGKTFLKPGQPLPAFQLETADGRHFDNASLRGHVTLVNFFFSNCVGCIEETPTLTAYAKKHPQQHVLAVTFDDANTAKAYVVAHAFDWPILVDGMAFDQAMGVNVYPVMALFGPDGRLQKMIVSAEIAHQGSSIGVGDLERWVGQSGAVNSRAVSAAAAPARKAVPAG